MNDPKLAAGPPPPGPALPALPPPAHAATLLRNRWVQLAAGVVAMVAVANLQYGWTLFVPPIDEKHRWGETAIQWAFTLFVLTETWLVPIEGSLADRFGPCPVVLAGGGLVGAAWAVNSVAARL